MNDFALLTPCKLLIPLVHQMHFLHPWPGRMYEICTVAIRRGGGGKRTASTIFTIAVVRPMYGGCTKKQPQQQNTTGQHFVLACVFLMQLASDHPRPFLMDAKQDAFRDPQSDPRSPVSGLF